MPVVSSGFDLEGALSAAKARSLAFDLVDVKRAAVLLGVSVRTVRRWTWAGRMPCRVKHGHRMKFHEADLQAMVAAASSGAEA
jgi:excisionase family DNA binding protein